MKIKLKNISTDPPENTDKSVIKEKTILIKKELDELQNMLYAEKKWSLLIIFQGLDGTGKDGSIKKVFSGLNPQGIHVKPFKVPTEEERAHDFLWRIHKHTPEKGMIQIFNRSHYEDVLVTRVKKMINDETAEKRFEHINNFEKLLTDNNTFIIKFYLHMSDEEQIKNLEERLTDPAKKWKYNPEDMKAKDDWPLYKEYYEEVFDKCSDEIPWVIIPADKNWYKEYFTALNILEKLKSLNLKFPGS
jgi:PPK2 family polyphosphate:nucleotide phosphotransferase